MKTPAPSDNRHYCHKYPPLTWKHSRHTFHLSLLQQLGRESCFEGAPALDPTPVIVPPTWDKSEHHRNLSSVWRKAAGELRDAENIFIIGYSLPETDAFFRYLYALGTVGGVPLKRLWVFNPDSTLKQRYLNMLGPAAASPKRFLYVANFATLFAGSRIETPITFTASLKVLRHEFALDDRTGSQYLPVPT